MDRTDFSSERVVDVVVWLFIALAGVGAAYVCFGVLKSEASGQFEKYSVGGAIAGAVVSWGVLTSVYLQLRGSSRELQDLREQANALQSKLIRGAPRPRGFETEIDERQRIVLARPKEWQPKGGTIFDLELSPEATLDSDPFSAAFRCQFVPIEKGVTKSMADYYERELQLVRESTRVVDSSSHERVRVGGEPGVESLKIIVRQAVECRMKKQKDTGRIERKWTVVPRDQFVGRIDRIFPAELKSGPSALITLYGEGLRKGGSAIVNGESRKVRSSNDWNAEIELKHEDIAKIGIVEIAWENADTAGKRSNSRAVYISGTALEAVVPPLVEASSTAEPAAPTANADGDTALVEQIEQVSFQEVNRMRLVVYHEALEKVFYFEFWDDTKDFTNSSAVFNQVIASTRFLD